MYKIAIDCRTLQENRAGMARATINLIKTLKSKFEFNLLLSDNNYLIKELPEQEYTIIKKGPVSKKINLIWENITLPFIIAKTKPEIYHAPFNTGIPLIKNKTTKYIVTIHDIIPYHFSNVCSKLALIKWHIGIRIALKRSDIIITVSEYSKNDIIKCFGVNKLKIEVIPSYVEDQFVPLEKDSNRIMESKKVFNLGDEYFIYYGGFREHKNVRKLIQVFNEYKRMSNSTIQLCIVGKLDKYFEMNVRSEYEKSEYKDDIVLTSFISDPNLVSLINGAKLIIYLSKYEGFGFPPLETMACGIPVVCARNSSMIEVLGDSAIWVENEETTISIVKKIGKVLIDDVHSDLFKKAGLDNIKNFQQKRYLLAMTNLLNY